MINSKDERGRTPVHLALKWGSREVALVLMKYSEGAKRYLRDVDKNDLFEYQSDQELKEKQASQIEKTIDKNFDGIVVAELMKIMGKKIKNYSNISETRELREYICDLIIQDKISEYENITSIWSKS